MASLTRQISRCCPFLKTCSILNSTELRKQSIKTWIFPLEQLGLLSLHPYRYTCQPVLKNSRIFLLGHCIQFSSSSTELREETHSLTLIDNPESKIKSDSDIKAIQEGREDTLSSALEVVSEDEALQIIAEPLLPLESFTFQDYVDHSETLHKLILLGVNLSEVEKRPKAGQLLLKLDFEKDISKILLFLKDIGVEDDKLGTIITKNPYILGEEVEDLEIRVSYLTSKKFTKEAIARMVSRAPYLLLFPVERLDNRLGFFHKELGLNMQKTRELVTRLPRLLTGSLEPIKENLKVYQLELGFSSNEIQHIVCTIPKILQINKRKLTEIFDYLHNIMGIPHNIIVHFPQVFNSKILRLKERHMFLKFLGRAQYDPKEPSYIPLERLVSLSDDMFCTEIAKATVQDFQKFQKTL